LAESFNATLKRETLQGAHAWPDQAACRRAVFGWVNRYNTRRRHSYCGQQPPIIYEQQHAATLQLIEQPRVFRTGFLLVLCHFLAVQPSVVHFLRRAVSES
jgi:hypothetical protein